MRILKCLAVNHGVPYVQGMMASTVGLLLLSLSEQEALKVVVRLFVDLNFSRFCRDGLSLLSQLAGEAVQIVAQRNGLEYQHFFSDPEVFAASQMLGFKLCVTLFADYVGLKEVGLPDRSSPASCLSSCSTGTRRWSPHSWRTSS